jgi:hypothetical protein
MAGLVCVPRCWSEAADRLVPPGRGSELLQAELQAAAEAQVRRSRMQRFTPGFYITQLNRLAKVSSKLLTLIHKRDTSPSQEAQRSDDPADARINGARQETLPTAMLKYRSPSAIARVRECRTIDKSSRPEFDGMLPQCLPQRSLPETRVQSK